MLTKYLLVVSMVKMVFSELNKLSDIPIHRSSQKYSKIGSGIVYYNNVNDLLDRMEVVIEMAVSAQFLQNFA